MSQIPWWGLPLTAVVSVLVGAVLALLIGFGHDHARRRAERASQWYEERRAAYVGLLAAYERTVTRLRTGFAAGITQPDALVYLDEVGPALMRMRLLASGPVRNAALAVHLLLQDLHTPRPAPPPGAEPAAHFLERLGHVPLVMHELEAAIRDELRLDAAPPPEPPAAPPRWSRARAWVARPRRPESVQPAQADSDPAG